MVGQCLASVFFDQVTIAQWLSDPPPLELGEVSSHNPEGAC